MASPTLNKKKFSCWNCDAFQANDPARDTTGQCRKVAPACPCGEASATFSGYAAIVTNDGGPAGWPTIDDGPVRWCLEWTLTTKTLPAPVYGPV